MLLGDRIKKEYRKNETICWWRSVLIPKEYMAKEPMTATEIRFRLGEFHRSDAMERLRQGLENTIRQTIEKVCLTPIQFRFPRSKKKRIRKKWRKDPRNFKPLVPDQFEGIQIVGMEN